MRIDWKEYAMRLADVAKLRSEDAFQKVGAAALDFNNRVIALGYNGLAPGKNVDPSFWDDRDARRPYMIHAETNLLSMVTIGQARLVACTLLPCTSCAQQLAAKGVKEVVYGETYEQDQKSIDIFKFYNIELTQLKL
jgi:dCMP deaminase